MTASAGHLGHDSNAGVLPAQGLLTDAISNFNDLRILLIPLRRLLRNCCSGMTSQYLLVLLVFIPRWTIGDSVLGG